VEDLLRSQGFEFESDPAWGLARVLTAEPFALGESLASVFGLLYIQDRSSMLPPLALDPPAGARVLDMCASPGSKTGLLAQLTGPGGFVLGVEASPKRLGTLRRNLERLSLPWAATAGASSQGLPFPDASFDHILLDPPCSGWGTADRKPEVLTLWTPDKVAPLVRLQRELLTEAARLLAPGGRLVYSTCTTNRDENEGQVRYTLDELGLDLRPLAEPPGYFLGQPQLPGMDGVLRIEGPSEAGQGFFLAGFGKPGAPTGPSVASADPGACEGAVASRRAETVGGKADGTPGREARSRRKGRAASGKPDPDGPSWGLRLDPGALRAPGRVRFDRLPDGELFDFNGRVFFLPRAALAIIPPGLPWQGHCLGKHAAGVFRPAPGARVLLPDEPGPGDLDVQDPAELTRLLSGGSATLAPGDGPAGLYFRGLPLGWLARKGTRGVWAAGCALLLALFLAAAPALAAGSDAKEQACMARCRKPSTTDAGSEKPAQWKKRVLAELAYDACTLRCGKKGGGYRPNLGLRYPPMAGYK
jgi:16S rRNA (cytosine1407-C5)-methyltransferase